MLRGGVYRQAVGSVSKPLTFQPYPGEHPVLSGADVVTGWTRRDGAGHDLLALPLRSERLP